MLAIDLLDSQIKESVKKVPKPARWLFNIAGGLLLGRLMARLKEQVQSTARPGTDWNAYWEDFIKKNQAPPEEAPQRAPA